jgi:hypothetical protein
MRLLRALILGAAVSAAALLSGCTSTGDGGASGVTDFLGRGVNIVSDGASVNRYIDFVKVTGDRESACIGIEAHRDVFDAFAAGFTVQYDPSMLTYTGFVDSDSCLGTGSTVLPSQVDSTTPGQLIVGVTRNAASTTTGVTCGRFIQLCFDVAGEGDTRLEFVGNRQLYDSTGAPVSVDWVDATVQTRQ